jgi:hypothetical protein
MPIDIVPENGYMHIMSWPAGRVVNTLRLTILKGSVSGFDPGQNMIQQKLVNKLLNTKSLSDETKNRGPLYLSVYSRASKISHTGGQYSLQWTPYLQQKPKRVTTPCNDMITWGPLLIVLPKLQKSRVLNEHFIKINLISHQTLEELYTMSAISGWAKIVHF